MRILSAILGLIALAFIVWFTVSNQQDMTLSLAKLSNALEFVVSADVSSDSITLPAYVWGFVIFGFGFFAGIFATIFTGGKARDKRRQLKRDLRSTRKELTASQKENTQIRENNDDLVDPIALIQRG